MKKFVLDANLYIDASRSAAKALELETFYAEFLPRTYLSAIVAQEVLAGAVDEGRITDVRNSYIGPFETRGRVVTPSFASWARSGEVIALLITRKLVDGPAMSRSFRHDVLLAVSCREAGMTLVTRNVSDFEQIRRVERFDFVAPWPSR